MSSWIVWRWCLFKFLSYKSHTCNFCLKLTKELFRRCFSSNFLCQKIICPQDSHLLSLWPSWILWMCLPSFLYLFITLNKYTQSNFLLKKVIATRFVFVFLRHLQSKKLHLKKWCFPRFGVVFFFFLTFMNCTTSIFLLWEKIYYKIHIYCLILKLNSVRNNMKFSTKFLSNSM